MHINPRFHFQMNESSDATTKLHSPSKHPPLFIVCLPVSSYWCFHRPFIKCDKAIEILTSYAGGAASGDGPLKSGGGRSQMTLGASSGMSAACCAGSISIRASSLASGATVLSEGRTMISKNCEMLNKKAYIFLIWYREYCIY